NRRYANPFDTMGYGKSHFNIWNKHKLNWLPDTAIQTITSDGVYRLYPFDVPTISDGRTYGLKIQKDRQREYWIETRQSLETNAPFSGSLQLNWSPWGNASEDGTQLLDTTPGTEGGFFDAPLKLGRSFYDHELGLKITPLRLGGSPAEFIDVLVT